MAIRLDNAANEDVPATMKATKNADKATRAVEARPRETLPVDLDALADLLASVPSGAAP